MARATQAQLERSLGGADKLLQLTRQTDLSGTAAQEFVSEVLGAGYAEVNSYISMAVDLADSALETAPLLVQYEIAVDAYLAWIKGTGGIGMPEEIRSEYERVIGELRLIGERKKGVGLVNRPTASQPIRQVTKSDSETYFSQSSPRKRFDGWS